jgi:hypothetical protein
MTNFDNFQRISTIFNHFWTFLTKIGHIQTIFDQSTPSLTMVPIYDHFWTKSTEFDQFRPDFDHSQPIFHQFLTSFDHFSLFYPIPTNLQPCFTIFDQLRSFFSTFFLTTFKQFLKKFWTNSTVSEHFWPTVEFQSTFDHLQRAFQHTFRLLWIIFN